MRSENGTVADFLLERLGEWGVRRVYGYPGDGINAITGAINRAGNEPEFVQAAHEELAAFMACAHAKYTGEVGVCLSTSGPGAIHMLNGLYDARLDRQPVVALVGQQPRMALGGSFQQEVDLASLFKDVAGAYVQVAMSPAQVRHLIDRAFRIALSERTVTCVILPHDVQAEEAVPQPPHAHGAMHSGVGYTPPRLLPTDEDLRRAADVLNAGERVAMLVGAGALHATDEITEVAETLGAGVAKALLGKAAVPDDLPFVTGSVGWLGTEPTADMMSGCDTLLVVGSSMPYTAFYPEEGQARGVQIDRDPGRLSLRYPMEVSLTGDSAETLRALLPYLERKTDRAWREGIEAGVSRWWTALEERAGQEADPLNPQLVVAKLSERLPDGCAISADSGTAAVWFARNLKVRRGMRATLSGTLATMGSGVPYATAAKFAHPDRVAIALVGDGAMQMNGINGLITIARYWRQWSDPRLVVLVLNNRDLSFVTWEQRAGDGEPRFPASQDVPDFPYASYAESIGLKGIRLDTPEAVAEAWDEALAADRPVLLEAVVDPSVPTLPPYLAAAQADTLAAALESGDPDAPGARRQLAREGYPASQEGSASG